MKNSLVVLGLLALFTVTASSVFAGSPVAMHVNIPFDFYAGGQQVAAGEYVVEMTSGLMATGSTVIIRKKDGEGICILLTQPGTNDTLASNMVRFNQYGDRLFLSSVSMMGVRTGFRMHKLERELRAQAEKEQKTVAIAMQ